MSFVVSLRVYSFLGVQLVFLVPSQIRPNTGYSFVASLVTSMILAILTAPYVYKFEREYVTPVPRGTNCGGHVSYGFESYPTLQVYRAQIGVISKTFA